MRCTKRCPWHKSQCVLTSGHSYPEHVCIHCTDCVKVLKEVEHIR